MSRRGIFPTQLELKTTLLKHPLLKHPLLKHPLQYHLMKLMPTTEAPDHRRNNFDLLRLLAAWIVLASHAFPLTGRVEPLISLGASENTGVAAVFVFFAISGLLITSSWERQPHLPLFMFKRAVRILPALATVGILTMVLVGPLVTSLSTSAYFASPQTLLYPLRIAALWPFGAELPGVFSDNPVAGAVNGSLWSLPVEVACYALVAALGVVGMLRSPRFVAILTLTAIIGATVWAQSVGAEAGRLSAVAGFAAGACAYRFQLRDRLDGRIAMTALLLVTIGTFTQLRVAAWAIGLTYLTIWLAYALPPVAHWVTHHGDVSYGLYLWAFPIQQGLVFMIGPDLGPLGLIALATPLAWAAGMLSWRLVERPALRWMHRPH